VRRSLMALAAAAWLFCDFGARGDSLVLTGAELEAIRDFVDPRKLKAKHLKRSKDDGVTTIDGRSPISESLPLFGKSRRATNNPNDATVDEDR
jgi:hypothetical protein